MNNKIKKSDKSTWAIGGSLLVGIGIGFIYIKENPMILIAGIIIGLGAGLIITSIISRDKSE